MNEKLRNDILFIHNVLVFGLKFKQFENIPLTEKSINLIKSHIIGFIECLKSGSFDYVLYYCVNHNIAINQNHYRSVLFLDDFDFDFSILNHGRNLLLVGNNFLTSAVLDPSILDKYDDSDAIRMINVSLNFDV